MSPHAKSRRQLLQELESLRAKLEETEHALQAIHAGETDAEGDNRIPEEGQEEPIEAKRLAQSVLERVREAVVVCDSGLRITRANAEARRLCGRDPVQERFDAAFPLQFEAELLVDVRVSLMQVLKGKSLQQIETGMTGATGAWVDLVLAAEPLRNQEQMTVGCVVTLTDITQYKR
ncbi:MAG: PAS domain-containing protein, partial [Bacillota bacterium]